LKTLTKEVLQETMAIKWLNCVKMTTKHHNFQSLSTSLQIGPFVLNKAHNLVHECKLVKDVFELHNHNSTAHIVGLKQANGDVLGLLIGGNEINNHRKNIVGPFGHPQIESAGRCQIFNQCKLHIFGHGCVTNARKISLLNTFFNGRFTFGHN
jgi:hypothetical protein